MNLDKFSNCFFQLHANHRHDRGPISFTLALSLFLDLIENYEIQLLLLSRHTSFQASWNIADGQHPNKGIALGYKQYFGFHIGIPQDVALMVQMFWY